jgi:hypothetical protein
MPGIRLLDGVDRQHPDRVDGEGFDLLIAGRGNGHLVSS